MTFNVGNGLAKPRRLVQAVRDSDADVVGLQELSDSQAELLEAELAVDYPHQVLRPGGFAGKGLLSRLPVMHSEQLTLYPERPDLQVTVDVNGAPLRVLVGHPPPPRLRGARVTFDPR